MGQRFSREQLKSKRQQTKDRLLRAGQEILTTEPLGSIAAHVRSGEVTKRANLSAGCLYYHWLSQQDYILDLVEYVLTGISEERVANANHNAQGVFTAALDEGKPMAVAVRDAGNSIFGQLQSDPSVFVQMALWAAHRDDAEITSRLKEMYDRVAACWVSRIEETIQRQGRLMRPPFTVDSLITTLIALAEGLLLRAKIDPAAVPDFEHPDGSWSLFAISTLGLYQTMTAPAPGTLPDIRDAALAEPQPAR